MRSSEKCPVFKKSFHKTAYVVVTIPAAPEHTRAKNNKAYYEKLLLTDKYAEGREDLGETIVRNPRNVDEYRNSHEFTTYEALCRGEDTQVRYGCNL